MVGGIVGKQYGDFVRITGLTVDGIDVIEGSSLGLNVDGDGCAVGRCDGTTDGVDVGWLLDGVLVGRLEEGQLDGTDVGLVGYSVGSSDGPLCSNVGTCDGLTVGNFVGRLLGRIVGNFDGRAVGNRVVGAGEGAKEGGIVITPFAADVVNANPALLLKSYPLPIIMSSYPS